MSNIFKEHFKINGGVFKTHEDEIEAYVKKVAIEFAHFVLSNPPCKAMFPEKIYQEFLNQNKDEKDN